MRTAVGSTRLTPGGRWIVSAGSVNPTKVACACEDFFQRPVSASAIGAYEADKRFAFWPLCDRLLVDAVHDSLPVAPCKTGRRRLPDSLSYGWLTCWSQLRTN